MSLGPDHPRLSRETSSPGAGRAEVEPLPELHAPQGSGARQASGIWRYAHAIPTAAHLTPLSLGEGRVPLEPLELAGLPRGVLALRDDLNPSGSWKDRGASLMVSHLMREGVREVVESGSRNAAMALARYGSRAGLRVKVFLPASSSPREKEMVESEGARVIEVPGPRSACGDAAEEAARRGAHWASYAARSWHALGAATAAFEIREALGRMPRLVALPLGHGSYLAGLARGFEVMAKAEGSRPPALVGIQSATCAPLRDAFLERERTPTRLPPAGRALTEAALVERPLRGREALAAVRASGGWVDAVEDLSLERALRLLWLGGFKVEASAALPVAWLLGEAARRDLKVLEGAVIILGGAGLRRGRPLFEAGWTTP